MGPALALPYPAPRVLRAHAPQLTEQLLRSRVKIAREDNLHRHELVASPRAFEMRHSHAAEAEDFAATGLWGDPHRRLAIHGGDVNLRPQPCPGAAARP